MNKSKLKKGILFILGLTVLIGVIYNVPTVKNGVNTYFAYEYLCEKYDEPKEAFELIEYVPYHINHDSKNSGVPFDYSRWGYLWNFKYNGTSFTLQRYKHSFKYFDDYQLEDASAWATQYLQQNVDANIVNVSVRTSDLFYFERENGKYKVPLESDNIEEYLKVISPCYVYYKSSEENITPSNKTDIENRIKSQNDLPFDIRIIDVATQEKVASRHKSGFSLDNNGHFGYYYINNIFDYK